MIAQFLGVLAGSRTLRALVRWAALALTIALFILSFRRTAERAGRLAERLDQMEKANDIQRRMAKAASRRPRLATSLLAACATATSERVTGVCPPLPAYSEELRDQAADELALLPPDSAIEELLLDYIVLLEQLRACG